jgi:hypothetical protein
MGWSEKKDKSLEDSDNLPDPDVLAREIVDDLEAALEQFREIATDLGRTETLPIMRAPGSGPAISTIFF